MVSQQKISSFLRDYGFHLWFTSLFHSIIAYILSVPSMDWGPVIPNIIKMGKQSQELQSCVCRPSRHCPNTPSFALSFPLMLAEILLKGRSVFGAGKLAGSHCLWLAGWGSACGSVAVRYLTCFVGDQVVWWGRSSQGYCTILSNRFQTFQKESDSSLGSKIHRLRLIKKNGS